MEVAMPSQTFQNLAEEKKQRIFGAIYEELKRVPFPEMSINQIIKNAGIPRGSFYQYFENKDDAFDFFVNESFRKIKECIMSRISVSRGDIFELAETVFEEIAKSAHREFSSETISHILPYIDTKKLVPFSTVVSNMEYKEKIEACSALEIGNLDIKSEQELMDIIDIIESLFQTAIPKIICRKSSGEEELKDFRRKLGIIRRATIREVV